MNQLIETFSNSPSQETHIVAILLLFSLVVGSFFNVLIHRLSLQMQGADPKELSTTKPAKSFCPNCKKPLEWTENIPVLSFMMQLGKCKGCKQPISWQYPLVELAAVAISLAAWKLSASITDAAIAIVFLDLLLVAAVIDARTKKIPNKLTIPGTIILLGLSALPGGPGIQWAAAGAAGCFLMMFGMAELGKKLFGKKKVVFKKPQEFLWWNKGLQIRDNPETTVENSERMENSDLPFMRPSDRILFQGTIHKTLPDGSQQPLNSIEIGPDEPATIRGEAKSITFPREAMGMGDAKLLLLAGAAMGFLPAVHGLVTGTVAAILVMMGLRVVAIAKKGNAPSLIAFGPWIAFGCAAVWVWRHTHQCF